MPDRMFEFRQYYYLNEAYKINDIQLKEYLSTKCNLKYIDELSIVLKKDIIENYVNIFSCDDSKILKKLDELKQYFDKKTSVDIEEEKNKFDGHYGC